MKPSLILILGLCLLYSCAKVKDQGLYSLVLNEYTTYEKSKTSSRDHWSKIDTAALSAELPIYTAMTTKIASVDTNSLSEDQKINLDMMRLLIQEKIDNISYGSHLMPLNAEGGFLTGILYRLQQQKIDSDNSAVTFNKLMQDLPRYLRQQINLMREGIRQGKISPKIIVENCVSILSNGINSETLLAQAASIENDSLQRVARSIINDSIGTALSAFQSFLSHEYLAAAPEAIGISEVPGGRKYYEDRIKYFTTYDISPEEVYNIGLREVARIRTEMEQIIAELKYKGDFNDFIEFLRTDERFYPQGRMQLLHYAAWLSKKMEGKLPQYFGKLPRMPFTVEPVPAAIAENYTAGRYSSGSYENLKAGAYWVNTTKLKSRPLYALPALTLHEAVPGHHLQIMLAAELEDLPDFRKTYLSAFGEGWALYCEWLGIEAGMYETPYDHFGRLTYEMWRACRLVVDVGMHYKGMTRDEAVDFMANNTALSLHEVNTEINRYIGWPAQAVSYKMGEIKIRELRKTAESVLGEKFNIRDFHDLVLKNGSIPLNSLESIVKKEIALKLAS